MSGHKSAVVTISQEEYRRLYEAERSLYYENTAQSSLEREHELEIQVRELAYHIEERESQYLNIIQELNDDLKSIEHESTQEMMNEQLNYLNEYIEQQENKYITTQEEIDQREQILERRLSEIQSKNDAHFIEMQSSVSQIHRKEAEIRQQAEEYLQVIQKLEEIIKNSYPMHIYRFNDFDRTSAEINLIAHDLVIGANQTALSLSQSLYLTLSRHKRGCDKRYLEWQLLQNQVVTDLELLKGNFYKNQRIQPIDKNGELVGEEIDTNYWTQGSYHDLEKNVLEMLKYVREKGVEISYPELKSIVNEFINPVQELLIQNLMDARINALNAQIRYEIANTVLVALVEQGFKPVTGDYQNGDYFQKYQASAVNSSGNQVDIFVEPGPTNQIENSLHVISQNHQLATREELHSRAREIRDSLIEHGLHVEAFKEISSETDAVVETKSKIPKRSSNRQTP